MKYFDHFNLCHGSALPKAAKCSVSVFRHSDIPTSFLPYLLKLDVANRFSLHLQCWQEPSRSLQSVLQSAYAKRVNRVGRWGAIFRLLESRADESSEEKSPDVLERSLSAHIALVFSRIVIMLRIGTNGKPH